MLAVDGGGEVVKSGWRVGAVGCDAVAEPFECDFFRNFGGDGCETKLK